MTILERIKAYGHENILCTHKTTIEITKEESLTKKGNCILGIKASKSCFDLDPNLKKQIRMGKKIKVTIKIDNLEDTFFGCGNKNLTLLDKKDIVFRKSDFICDRTALINCTKSSNEINSELIEKLKIPKIRFLIFFEEI